MAKKKAGASIAEIQAGVNQKFLEIFGRTPLKERLDDILRLAIRTSRFSDLENLKEQTGDILNSVLQLCSECGWSAEELSAESGQNRAPQSAIPVARPKIEGRHLRRRIRSHYHGAH